MFSIPQKRNNHAVFVLFLQTLFFFVYRCLHHMCLHTMPVIYMHSRNAWMIASIFEEWFHHHFVPVVKQHLKHKNLKPKVVLLLDNCPAHAPKESVVSRCGKVCAAYLPKNTTSVIQPLNQGTFKRLFWKHLVVQYLKYLNLKDAIHLLSKA